MYKNISNNCQIIFKIYYIQRI